MRGICPKLLGILIAAALALPTAAAQEKVRLSAADVERLALEQSYGVKQVWLASDAVQQNIMQSKGIFDTNLGADVSYQLDDSAKASRIMGGRIDTLIGGVSATKKLPSGTEVGIGLAQERVKYHDTLTINGNPVFPPNALYEPIISFSLSQPVMKNIGGYQDRRAVKSAELGALAAELTAQRQVETLVYGALSDYWNLVIVRRLITARVKSVQFARQFLATTEEEFKLGTAEETDVLAARANILVRDDDLRGLKEVERSWEESLRTNLAMGPDVYIENVEKEPPLVTLGGSIGERIAGALETRRDYQASKRELELRDVELAVAKNERWPSMDLYSTLQLNEIRGGISGAWSSANNPNWTVGMQFKMPLENRVARSGKNRADIQKAAAIVALKDLENRIANSVSRHAKEVDSRKKIISQSGRAMDLQREKLRQENEKYGMGRSTSDLIVRYQDDVVAAEQGHAEAWLAYKEAALNLVLAEGKLVDFDKMEEQEVSE